MARAEGARGALAMDEQVALSSGNPMRLLLAGVVRNVEQQIELRLREVMAEHAPRQVGNDLPVGQRAIDRRAHRAEVALRRVPSGSARRPDRDRAPRCRVAAWRSPSRADSRWRSDGRGRASRNGCSPRSRPVAVRTRRRRPGRRSPRLPAPPDSDCPSRACPSRAVGASSPCRTRRRASAPAITPLSSTRCEILGAAIAALHRPARPALQHRVHLGRIEVELALAADAGRDLVEQTVGQCKFHRFDIGARQAGEQACARRRKCRSRRRRRR